MYISAEDIIYFLGPKKGGGVLVLEEVPILGEMRYFISNLIHVPKFTFWEVTGSFFQLESYQILSAIVISISLSGIQKVT